MPLTPMQLFHCDFKGDENETACEVEFYYKARCEPRRSAVPGLASAFAWSRRNARSKLITLMATHAAHQRLHNLFYCGDEHAIQSMACESAPSPEARKVAPANEAEMAAVQRGMGIVSDMRKGKPS